MRSDWKWVQQEYQWLLKFSRTLCWSLSQAAFPSAGAEGTGPRVARVEAGMGFPAQATNNAGSTDAGYLVGPQAEPEEIKGNEVPEDESLETAAEHGYWGSDG